WRRPVHQVAMENIRDVHVDESDGRGPTLRDLRRNRVVRVSVRMKDKRVVALPKTDAAAGGVKAVRAVAQQLRQRLAHLRDRAAAENDLRPALTAGSPAAAVRQDDELRIALLRLRQQAAAERRLKAVPASR
ncbi:MAG TPA: hypothetical protein VFZ93_05525, partial [Albitalea sp.]